MERYLVTGGAGFIGSQIVEALLEQGAIVRVIDNFDTGTRENLADMKGNLEVIDGGIEDPSAIALAVKGIDYVFHQAARGSVPRSVEDPLGTHQANVTGSIQLLFAAWKAGVKRVLCASSSSIYGESEVLPKRESMEPSPLSPYALSKSMLEQYCSLFYRVYGLETVCLRYFNVYGLRQNPNLQYAAVVPIFIKNMIRNLPCTIFGDGQQTRDFTFIGDCVRANLEACKAPNIAGEVFNVASEQQTSVDELFHLLKTNFPYYIDPVYSPERPGDIKHSYGSGDKARDRFGFQPTVSLADGLKHTVQWYRERESVHKNSL